MKLKTMSLKVLAAQNLASSRTAVVLVISKPMVGFAFHSGFSGLYLVAEHAEK